MVKFKKNDKVIYKGKEGKVKLITHQKTDKEVFVIFGKNDVRTINIKELTKV